ncbi:MAG: MarR family transcriptional regulator [Dehalococcoidia bacterium]|nr:MarR family transcriptional regulator [Dehalococcoidia bacterium]MCB9484799.1 MarR family transcriptional regulator [Thermoflexaceae bacterium]
MQLLDTREPFTDGDYQALYAFRTDIRRFLSFSEDAARAAGVEPQQHQLLLLIRATPGPVRIAAIASGLGIRHHTAVGLVDRTVARGLITREPSETDRRVVHVLLTPEGEAILAELSIHHHRELQDVGPALVRALKSITDGLTQPTAWPALDRETGASR